MIKNDHKFFVFNELLWWKTYFNSHNIIIDFLDKKENI